MPESGVPSTPFLGETVIYVSRNGDGIESPAIVLRTQATTNLEVLSKWPERPSGFVEPGAAPAPNTLSGKWRPDELVPELSSEYHVDLVVFGLGGEHRQFNVPMRPVVYKVGDDAHTWHFLDQ